MNPSVFDALSNFTTVFLGIFIEATPFLLLGTVASGLVEVFVQREDLLRWLPRQVLLATLAGGLLGLAFPVCECGAIPLTQRLYRKGLPISTGIAFLLAAPIINPLTIFSTYAAYGWGTVLLARLGLGLLVATCVGLLFQRNPAPLTMLRAPLLLPVAGGVEPLEPPRLGARLHDALRIAGDEFFDMGRYLVVGCAIAALMQTFVSQKTLLAVGSGPLASVLVMQALAFVLSVCSTVDAFISLAFVKTFTVGSILSFLVFGPMVDVKSTLMFLSLFRRRIVFYLVLLPFLLVTMLSVFINLNVSW
jgi:hypothetical protein